ncbi:MAG: DUF507 family protein [Deltaproteobacteria bacterium]|nr:DUF507 family protein [Deltaproteobacteria bacterium]
MQLSDDRISHIAHGILDRLRPIAGIPDETRALREIKRRMTAVLKVDDVIDGLVRQKIASLKRHVPEGASEWDILYKKYYEEEAARRRR